MSAFSRVFPGTRNTEKHHVIYRDFIATWGLSGVRPAKAAPSHIYRTEELHSPQQVDVRTPSLDPLKIIPKPPVVNVTW